MPLQDLSATRTSANTGVQSDAPSRGTSPGGASSGNNSAVKGPTISLPKGGGAIGGIGEKFAANPVTGTGSFSVPLAVSPGRSGFGPQLSLAYDSGSGNGPFGFGWSLNLPQITRKTDKGLPLYRDSNAADDSGDSDVFILSGAEDLVPVLKADGSRFVDTTSAQGFAIHRYRPRIEGLFARIERWSRQSDGDVHWRSISRDNILTLYGNDEKSRIADPLDAKRIFTWLICESRDDKGNVVLYDYKPEDGVGVKLERVHERNRGDGNDRRRTANRYLRRIRYGNRVSLLDNSGQRPRQLTDAQIQNAGWSFEVLFDYGEHDANLPKPDDGNGWNFRDDPFSSYRAGFEIRTTRLCQRVLLFHHIPDFPTGEKGYDGLVRSTDFTYSHELNNNASNPIYTFMLEVSQKGYKPNSGGYLKRSLPPLTFEYSPPIVQEKVEEVEAESLENLPGGVGSAAYAWTDLHGEGIPGILSEQGGAWFYKRNISPRDAKPGSDAVNSKVKFAPVELVALQPNLALAGGQAQFMDLAGDGQPALVALDGAVPGLYEHDDAEGWQPFRPFSVRLNREMNDPDLKLIDLDGDGHADVLISEDDAFVWHKSLAEAGFEAAQRLYHGFDEEKGPRLIFADADQSIYLADLCGDGLTDLVRIRNGEVCYWPNLGYGRFGAKIQMDHAPYFDNPDHFDQRRIHLADIDGSGTNDIIYLHREGVRLYFNQSGNSWGAPQPLSVFPYVDDLVNINVADLLGNGTACLVWSSPLAGDQRRQMRYVNLMGGQKPHLLIKMVNNLGTETVVEYASSTKFYLQDKYAGKPWITRLPFPVHVVERVETYDRVSNNRFVTRNAYHHGYFDGDEREFRGFGLVEQMDTEEYDALSNSATFPTGGNIDQASHVPPVLTKSWFHTGAYRQGAKISRHHQDEYFHEPGLSATEFEARLLPDTELPPGLTAAEIKEAVRALKGGLLRQEVFARDGSPRADYPYSVSERSQKLKLLQAKGQNANAVFYVCSCTTLDYHYERDPADPRISHQLSLQVDDFGNVLRAATIGYGRRQEITVIDAMGQPQKIANPALNQLDADDQIKQKQLLFTSTENRFTTLIDLADDYRTPLPCESRSFEVTGVPLPTGDHYDFATVDNATTNAIEIVYESVASGSLQKRLIEHLRTFYRSDDLASVLPLGQNGTKALPFESHQLAFTPGLVTAVFGSRVSDAMLITDGKYIHSDNDNNWWISSGQLFYSPNVSDTPQQEVAHASAHFFLPHRFRDPFGESSFVRYDLYDLLMLETEDPLQNKVTVGERTPQGTLNRNDYRVLQPEVVTDPNGNRSQVAFDALGMVVGIAVMGKLGESVGDSLTGFVADLDEGTITNHILFPFTDPHSILGNATTRLVYDLHRYRLNSTPTNPQPALVYTLARETHLSDLTPNQQSKIQHSFIYSDGFGRAIQQVMQAEAGPVPVRDPNEMIIVDANGQPLMTTNDFSPRWVCSGWTVYNNKGKPVRQYEPFFNTRHAFEFDVRIGISSVLFYDPVERVVATLHYNHSWQKVIFDPWRQESWDVNDTVLVADPRSDATVGDFFRRLPIGEFLPTWHEQRANGGLGPEEERAAFHAAIHAATPTITHADAIGRTIHTVAHNKFKYSDTPAATPPTEESLHTWVVYDIENNQRTIIDENNANGLVQRRDVMRYDYDMLGNRIHQAGMEVGERWMLNNVTGMPFFAWDSRNHHFQSTYDLLQRPLQTLLHDGGGNPIVVGRSVYGESLANPEANNLRGQVHQLFDQAGVSTSVAYDFKGNLLHSQRQLAELAEPLGAATPAYKSTLNWEIAAAPLVQLESVIYNSLTRYDALNRPTQITEPDNSIIRLTYNEANLLEKVEANLRGTAVVTPFVNDIDYDAKGQRTRIEYGNGVITTYDYEVQTLRLSHLQTLRGSDALQEFHYTYDAVGNITHIRDDAQQTIFFRNQRVEPNATYIYDALYRLIEATGREQLGLGSPPVPHSYNDFPRTGQAHRGDGDALGTYIEQYRYDAAGNILQMQHIGSAPFNSGWTRTYTYNKASPLDGTINNCLSSTSVGSGSPIVEPYSYNEHGSMAHMPHLQIMQWDFNEQLQMTQRQAVNPADSEGLARHGERTWYVYDASGQRVRKVTESATGQLKDERIYLGGLEIYRRNGVNPIERETLHIMDDQQRIALVETRIQGNEPGVPAQLIRYQFGNHLGSASLEVDDQAQIITYEEYTPYGSTSYQAGRSQTEVQRKRYRYTGKERDEETGLNYHGARYYAPSLGRWTSADPAGFVDGPNLYVYAVNNPIVRFDSTGMDSTNTTDISFDDKLTITKLDKDGEPIERTVYGVVPKNIRTVEAYKSWAAAQGIKIEGPVTIRFENGKPIFESTWFHLPGEQKEEEDSWYSPSNIVSTAADFVVGTKARFAFEFAKGYYETGSPFEALKGAAINTLTDMVIDKGVGKLLGAGKGAKKRSTGGEASKAGGAAEVDKITDSARCFTCTPHGVVLPPSLKYKIPDHYIENPHRIGSYGEKVNGKFVEKLRIDPATPPGKKGPNYPHYHKNGKGEHYSPRPGDRDPGFSP